MSDHPLAQLLPLDLRKQIAIGDFADPPVQQGFNLRRKPWPQIQMIGGGSGDGTSSGVGMNTAPKNVPDIPNLRSLSEKLLAKLEEQTLERSRAPSAGTD